MGKTQGTAFKQTQKKPGQRIAADVQVFHQLWKHAPELFENSLTFVCKKHRCFMKKAGLFYEKSGTVLWEKHCCFMTNAGRLTENFPRETNKDAETYRETALLPQHLLLFPLYQTDCHRTKTKR